MTILVTGGGGFLGKAVVKRLLELRYAVRSFSRGDYPELVEMGVDVHQGDLADYTAVDGAVNGCDAVIHCAAKAGVSVDYLSFFRPNLLGTQNVLDACKRRDVSKLVYTSTPSVTFTGEDQEGIGESTPYPAKFNAHYPRTKAAAERLVLQANGPTLSTVALRPHLIWGPGDTQLIPRIIERARAGRMRFIGGGKRLIDATYIDNAAHAHVLALQQLAPDAPCAGKPYFITNDAPMPFADVVNGILAAAGLDPVSASVSPRVAYAMGTFLEAVYVVLRRRGEPSMTRFVARQFSTAHWYDISAAKEDLGYEVLVSMEDGMRRLAEDLGKSVSEERIAS